MRQVRFGSNFPFGCLPKIGQPVRRQDRRTDMPKGYWTEVSTWWPRAVMEGLITARTAVLSAIAAIDADMKRMARASGACRRLMTIPGVGQLTALAFTATVDDPGRFRRSRDIGANLGLVPRRYQSGEVDFTGSISKCGDRRMRTLLYEAANVMLTRYRCPLKLKDWALALARRSTMRKARIALARRLAIIMHAMLRHGTDTVACGQLDRPTALSTKPFHTQLTPSSAT